MSIQCRSEADGSHGVPPLWRYVVSPSENQSIRAATAGWLLYHTDQELPGAGGAGGVLVDRLSLTTISRAAPQRFRAFKTTVCAT
jgi:hypothetical protein